MVLHVKNITSNKYIFENSKNVLLEMVTFTLKVNLIVDNNKTMKNDVGTT